jgi:hypothetical protein
MKSETIEMLKQLAARKCWNDNNDFSAFDYSGGNFDDAYQGGYDDGQANLALEVLKLEGIDVMLPM